MAAAASAADKARYAAVCNAQATAGGYDHDDGGQAKIATAAAVAAAVAAHAAVEQAAAAVAETEDLVKARGLAAEVAASAAAAEAEEVGCFLPTPHGHEDVYGQTEGICASQICIRSLSTLPPCNDMANASAGKGRGSARGGAALVGAGAGHPPGRPARAGLSSFA